MLVSSSQLHYSPKLLFQQTHTSKSNDVSIIKMNFYLFIQVGTNILKDIINYNFEQQQVNSGSDVAIEQEVQPMQTNVTDPPSSGMNMFSRPTSSILMTEPDQAEQDPTTPVKNIEQLEIPDPEVVNTTPNNFVAAPDSLPAEEEMFTSGIRITKSNSVALRKKGGSVGDVSSSNSTPKTFDKRQQRWSSIPSDPSRLERLEHRLSLLSDDADDTSITSIKNMVRKVSNAFNSSYQQAYEDSPRSLASGESNISHDLGKILGSPMPQELEKRYSVLRESTEGVLPNTSEGENIDTNQTRTSVILDTELGLETQHMVSPADDSGIISSEANDSNEDLNKRWSTDVDQVFDEVNADLDSIADSIASDHGRISDSEAQEPAAPFEVTSIGLDITQRAAIVDMRLKEASNSSTDTAPSPTSSSTKKGNFEVKRVADRIKEYKRLIDAEKRRTSWRRREPRPINEMMESLDTIHSKENRLKPAYSNMRRRYRTSRDLEGSSINSSTDPSPRSSCSSIKRSMSENFASALENSQSCPVSYSSTPSYDDTFTNNNTERTLTDSVISLNNKKDVTLDNSEDITKRTQRYQKALENFDGRPRFASTGAVKSEQTVVLRRRPKGKRNNTDNVVCRNSGDWTRKAQTLPHPRRLKAIKRIARTDSEEASDDTEPELAKEKSVEEKRSDSSSAETNSSEENKNNKTEAVPASKKYGRSISLPRQKKRQVSNSSTIHEEISSKYVNPRLSSRSNSNPENDGPRALIRGRVRDNSKSDSSNKDHTTSTLPRGRKREVKSPSSETNDKTSNTHRSVSLPRRAPGLARNNLFPTKRNNNNNKKNSENKENSDGGSEQKQKSSSITIMRSPSIRCIQSNHVNNRIKDYFVNLQRSAEISRSRPNLVIIGNNGSESDADADDAENEGEVEMSSNEEQTSNDDDEHNNNERTDKKDQILKGTVRSMIQKYGKQNYVFD